MSGGTICAFGGVFQRPRQSGPFSSASVTRDHQQLTGYVTFYGVISTVTDYTRFGFASRFSRWKAHPCHARRRDQGRTCVERHDARPSIYSLNHVTFKQALMSVLAPAPMVSLPSVDTHGWDGLDPPENMIRCMANGTQLLARMEPLMQPGYQALDRALPTHPARQRALPRRYQHPDIHVRRALA